MGIARVSPSYGLMATKHKALILLKAANESEGLKALQEDAKYFTSINLSL